VTVDNDIPDALTKKKWFSDQPCFFQIGIRRTLCSQAVGIAKDSHCASRELTAGCDCPCPWRASSINQNEALLMCSSL